MGKEGGYWDGGIISEEAMGVLEAKLLGDAGAEDLVLGK